MPINPNIALGVQPLQLADPMAQYGKVIAIQGAQQQNRLADMQMRQYELEQGNKNAMATAYAQSFDPTTRKLDYDKLTGLLASGGQGAQIPAILKQRVEEERAATEEAARRAKLMQDTQAMYQNLSGQISTKQDAARLLQTMINDPAMKDSPIARIPLMQQIQRIPEDPQGLDNWVKQFSLGATKYITENKPTTQQVNRGGVTELYQSPGLGGTPKLVGSYADLPLPANVMAQKKEIAREGASNISLSTEKKYGEQFAGKIAEADITKMTTAEKAPQLAESANRIIDLVRQGDVFTGPAADIKLNIARAMNVAGASNQEKIANTESLIAATGQSTLDAIKGAGLGTGQGFTDKDLKFLQGVAGGTINLTQKTLMDLATLQHRVAVRSAESWNKRVNEMPQEVVRGTGLSTQPIKVPALSSVMGGQARPAGVGANWTFERDAAGNTAWVSPDRKSFKEAQ